MKTALTRAIQFFNMKKVNDAPNEPERLSALLEYHILDTPQEHEFDSIARLAAVVCQTPMAAVSFIDSDRQWLKARYGIFISETPRDQAICAYTILSPDLHVVNDTLEHRIYRKFPFTKGGPGIRFYAGQPIRSHSGCFIGTICVMDHCPRDLNGHQRQTLIALGNQVEVLLEHRRTNTRLRELKDFQDRLLHYLLADVTSSFSATGTFLNLLSDIQADQASLLSLTPKASRQFHRTLTILQALIEWGNLHALNRSREWSPTDAIALFNDVFAHVGRYPAARSFTLHLGEQLPGTVRIPDTDLHFTLKYLLLWLCDCAETGELTVSPVLSGEDRLTIRLLLSSSTISSARSDLAGRFVKNTTPDVGNMPTQEIFLRLAAEVLFKCKGDLLLNKGPGWMELAIELPLHV